jgi:site-specific recombinase XerD
VDIQILAQKFYDYSLYFRGYSQHTIRRYKYAITFYCKFANVSTIDQVTEENVRAFFFYGRTERSWSTNTFEVIYKSLKVFFRWCQSERCLDKNPTDDIEVPKHERKLPIKLTKQDALKLLEIVYNYPYEYPFVRYRNHALFATFIFAGLRKNELLKLLYTDVDLENLTIFVRRGKGAKDRIIPISYTLAQSLKRYLEERKRLKKTCPEFFASSHRNCGFTEDGLEHLVTNLREASGMKFTVHKLRHTFATLMLEGGCDIYSLSRMMGHSDIKTTTIYLYASPEHLRSQMTKHPLNNLVT